MAKETKTCVSCGHRAHARGQCFTSEGRETIGVGSAKTTRTKMCGCETETK